MLLPRKVNMNMANREKYYSLPSYFIIATLILLFFIKRSFVFHYEIIAVSLFLCTVPNLLIKRYSIGIIASFEILFLSLLAFIMGSKGVVAISFIAMVGVAYTAKLMWQNRLEEIKRWPDILGVILLAFLSAHYFWFYGYFSPDFEIEIINGIAHKDELFHMAISNMLINEFVPSTGLHFTPYLPYHYFSHFVFGIVRVLTGLKIYQVYPYALPFLVFPFFIQFLQSFIRNHSTFTGHFLLLPIFLFGVTSIKSGNHPWNYYLISESYLVGIVIIFAFLYSNTIRLNNWTNFVLIFLGFLVKISVGLLLFFAHFFLVFISKLNLKNKTILLTLTFVSAILAYLLTVGGSGGVKKDIIINWFYLHKIGFSKTGYLTFIWGRFYIFFLMAITFWVCKKGKLLKSENFFMPIAIIAFLLGIVAVNVEQPGIYYFVNLSMWISMPFLLIFSIDIINKKPDLGYKRYLFFLVLILFCLNLFSKFNEYLFEYWKYSERRPAISQKGKLFLPYYEALKKAGEFDKKREYVVEIPESETIFWQHHTPLAIPFYIPVISGRPAINGYDVQKIANFSYFGYSSYWDQPPIDLCQNTKYKGVIRIWRDNQGEVVSKPFDCKSSFVKKKRESKFDFIRSKKNGIFPKITNGSFERGLEGWNGPGDCSNSWPGEPVFTIDFSDDATNGQKSLRLTSENHILGVNTRIQQLKKGQFYRLSFDAKRSTGKSAPNIYLGDKYGELRQSMSRKIDVLPNGWRRYTVIFKSRCVDLSLYLYCRSSGEKNTVLYDNLRVEKHAASIWERMIDFFPIAIRR